MICRGDSTPRNRCSFGPSLGPGCTAIYLGPTTVSKPAHCRQSYLWTLDPKLRPFARNRARFLHQLDSNLDTVERGIQHDVFDNAHIDPAQTHGVTGSQTMSLDKLDCHPWSG